MRIFLPPLRLIGATTLRDRELQKRSVAIANGKCATGAFPTVDLTGYYVLPGIVDLHACMDARDLSQGAITRAGLNRIERRSARFGVTTRYLAQPCVLSDATPDLEHAKTTAGYLAADDREELTDLRLQLLCELHAAEFEAALLSLVRECRIDVVVFSNLMDEVYGLFRAAHSVGAGSENVTRRAQSVSRQLCRLAEEFDRMGIIYGSLQDSTAEVREHLSMIGARLCLNPGTVQVAFAARAVGDPVASSAADLIGFRPDHVRVRAVDLIQHRLCDALVSDTRPDSLARAAFSLADAGILALSEAWRLVSELPARLMRLPDRGVIEQGMRADLVIANAETQAVEATITGGTLVYATDAVSERFFRSRLGSALAAE